MAMLSYGSWSKMLLQCINSTNDIMIVMRQSPGEWEHFSSSQTGLLCEDTFTAPQRAELQGRALSQPKVLLMFSVSLFDCLSSRSGFTLTSFFLVPDLMEPDVKGRWLAHISCWRVSAALFVWLYFIYLGPTGGGE